MKLVPVIYYGFTGMDIRFSTPMLPWLVSEIRKRDYNEKLSLGIENGVLQAYNPDFELQFSHRIVQMIRFSQADLDPCTFLYLLRDDNEKTLYCYLYQALHLDDVSEIYKQMKEQSSTQNQQVKSNSTGSNLTSLCVDISPSSSNFFEVLYIGKIKVWNKKVPETFIDDALEKFKAHDLEKNKHKLLGNIGRLRSDDHIRRGSCDSTGSDNPTEPLLYPPLLRSQSTASHLGGKNLRLLMKQQEALEENSTTEDNTQQTTENNNTDRLPTVAKDTDDIDDNRTMVLQIDRTDLRLISPDRKVILLQKHHKDIATCVQALVSSEHFGFISKETSNTNNYIGYIFKCESASIASDAVAAIKQSFGNSEGKSKAIVTSCEHCPMIWFHKLCTEIEHLTDRKTYAAILRRIEQLDDEEQNTILTKFRGAQTDSLIEQNEFLMMLLRAHCEQKQGRHVHDTAENRSEFLNQYLGGGKIFMKAKRSLSNSFEILKKKASRDDFSATLREMNLPINNINRECSPAASIAEVSDHDSNGTRSRSSTIDSQSDAKDAMLRTKDKMKEVSPDQGLKSPMMDIFMKVGSTKSATQEDSNDVKVDTGSWRQAIFKRVITPSNVQQQSSGKKTREELRELWKKSIHQAILLVRMEKENARIKAQQEESAMKRIKLEYDEMKPNQREKMDIWELVTNKERTMKVDKLMLLSAIKQGIPRGKRGDAWQFLAEQYCARIPPVDLEKYPNYNTPYETLLKQLTSHQHAILIDLGRTFPNHSYFSSPLGPGQLALFNLLKAYSLLDPEVGYCQGLSFVVGVLLLHMEESQAFFLLRHLMFRRSLRKQYLPDMTGLQVRLYQLSRLLHDRIPEVYQHFDRHDVAPTLYAAPWLLTIFASQFPLGFVTRVYDLLFLEGLDIVFRVTLALLTHHKDNLLKCDGFEEIMDYLKNTLPDIDKPTLDRIMKEVYNTDVTKQLNDYKVEYHVIQEEMASVQPQLDQLEKLQYENKKLKEKTKNLASQLDLTQSNAQRLEKTRTLQQAQLNKLEMNSRSLNVTIETLGSFINNLIEEKVDIEIPDDVQRILSQISVCEKRKSELKPQNSFMNLFKRSTTPPNKLMVKSLSTGKIPINTLLDQNVLRSNSLNTQTKQEMSEPNKPSFFSNNHSNILAQQKNVSPNLSLGSKIDITVQDFEETNHGSKDLIILESPTLSTDSGVGTPLSPRIDVGAPLTQKIIEPLPPKKIDADTKIVEPSVHPLSNPDVNFTFNGTRELQNIKNLKNLARNSSPDLLRKQLS